MHYVILYSLNLSIFNFLSKQTFKETKGFLHFLQLCYFSWNVIKRTVRKDFYYSKSPLHFQSHDLHITQRPQQSQALLSTKTVLQVSVPLLSASHPISFPKAIINSLSKFSFSSSLQALQVIRCLKQTQTLLSHYHPQTLRAIFQLHLLTEVRQTFKTMSGFIFCSCTE